MCFNALYRYGTLHVTFICALLSIFQNEHDRSTSKNLEYSSILMPYALSFVSKQLLLILMQQVAIVSEYATFP